MKPEDITTDVSLALRIINLMGPTVETRTGEAQELNINPMMFSRAMRLGLVMHDHTGYRNSKRYSLTMEGELVLASRGWDKLATFEGEPTCPHDIRFKQWLSDT